MTLPAPTYDLVMLLDPQADEPTRAKLVADARAAVEARGELLRHDAWGERALAYPIDRKASAEYHLLQFHVATTELLDELDRTLRLADDVLRFRIVKLAPGVGAPPDMSGSAGAAPPRRAEAETAVASEAAPAAAAAAEAPPAEAAPAEAPPAEAAPAEAAPAEAAAEPSAPSAADAAAEVAVGEPS